MNVRTGEVMRVLGATERITVGTTISIPSAQHPVTLSEQTALFDHLSAGRFQLGVGRGGPWMDLELFQTGLDRYDVPSPSRSTCYRHG